MPLIQQAVEGLFITVKTGPTVPTWRPLSHCEQATGIPDWWLRMYAVSQGLSPEVAMRAVCSDAARMLALQDLVGRLAPGLDGDDLLLDGPPLAPATRVLRAFVGGEEVR